MASTMGLEIPPEITRWLVVALVGCLSLVVVQGSVVSFALLRKNWGRKEREAAVAAARDDEVGRNLSSLNMQEMEALAAVLPEDAPIRFEVPVRSVAYRLVQKKLFRAVTVVDGAYLCELNEIVAKNRVELLKAYQDTRATERR